MCCLKNEEETYEELNSHLPGIGDYVTTPDKLKGEVLSVSVLRQRVKVVVTTGNDEKRWSIRLRKSALSRSAATIRCILMIKS